MKCPRCDHVVVEVSAKFCSQCGINLTMKPSDSIPDKAPEESDKVPVITPEESDKVPVITPEESAQVPVIPPEESAQVPMITPEESAQVPVIPLGTDEEMPGTTAESSALDNRQKAVTPKRLNDDNSPKPHKKRKKKRKNKRRASDKDEPSSLTSDHSVISLTDKDMENRQEQAISSDSEESACAMDETTDPLSCTVPESPPLAPSEPVAGPGPDTDQGTEDITPLTQGQKSQFVQDPSPSKDVVMDSDGTASSCQSTTEGPDQSKHPKKPKTGSQRCIKDQKESSTSSSSSNKAQITPSQNTNMDHNANISSRPHKQTPKSESLNLDDKKSPASHGGAVNGSQRGHKVMDQGSSVDSQTLQTSHGKGDASSGIKHSEPEKRNTSDETGNKKTVQPPKRIPNSIQQPSVSARLIVYFHAVLSKDFKFDPDEDRIFIRAGSHIGDWEENLVEVFVSRNLGEHGFLVEGKLVSTKDRAEAVSIPYKYIIYKTKKEKYEYEYIYKLDSNETTNRCLFVKANLLNEEGEWHQYDDIICAAPSKSVLKKLKETIWPEQRKSVIQGREIAGKIMLDTIFDLLRSWSEVNLRSFVTQLKQFHQLYGNPFIYEEVHKKWYSLDYSEKDVSNLIKHFMLESVIPEIQKDATRTSAYIKGPLKAAVIMLYVWKQHDLKLDKGELARLCTALCLPDLPKEEFLAFWTDVKDSLSCLKNLPDIVVELMNTVKSEGIPRWTVVIPLLHLLKGISQPFEPIISHTLSSRSERAWDGLQGVKTTSATQLSSQDRRAMLNLMQSNRHLVEVDRLLPRSWLCLMTADDLVEYSTKFHVELLDILQVFIQKLPADISYSNSTCVSDTLTFIQSQLLEQKYRCFSDYYGRDCVAVAVKLLEKMCSAVKTSYTHNFTDIPIACLNLVVSVAEFSQSFVQERQDGEPSNVNVLELLSRVMRTIRTWIGQTFKRGLLNTFTLSVALTPEFEMWNNIISISFHSKDFTKEWRETFIRDFEGKFQQESSLNQIEVYCSKIEDLNESHPHVAKCIERCALQAVSSICQAKTEGRLFERIKINWKFGKLISAIIQKSWPRSESGSYEEEEEVVLQHLLNWTAAKNIFQLHGADEKLIDQLSEEAKNRLAVATSLFTNISHQLLNGDIRIKILNHILNKMDTFIELLKIDCLCESEQCRNPSAMKRLLQSRQREVEAIYHEDKLVKGLIAMLQKLQEHVTVDYEDLEEKIQIDIDEMRLNMFMEVHPFKQIPSPMAGVVTYFNLDEDVQSMAKELYTFEKSYIFKMCWESQAKIFARLAKESLSLDEDSDLVTLDVIYFDIFQPCYEKYRNIYAILKNGSMTFEDVDVIFKAYMGKYEELADDVAVMCELDASDDKQWIQRRIQQIEQYHELHLAVESAQVVMNVKQTLCLQGDFQVLEKLLEVTHLDFKKERLDSIDNELMQAKTVLVDITETRRLCLQELGLRKNFVMWVKEALEDINELKVFVDLASISAGENDLDVDRVACFHDAVLGYSPMLYELKSDAGFRIFKEVLKKLWKALDNDPNLTKKLRDTARHLEWLKTVKDSHGSVELSSLSLASTINKKGIYTISAEKQKKLSMDKVIKLQIPEVHDEGLEIRCYSLEDLRDLQNKLMLMSGKGEQGHNEVDQFAEVFAGVQRLASAFIDLFVAGNPLFRRWETNISCNNKEACIVMDFHLEDVSIVLVKGNTAEQLPQVCKKMEKCLRFWNHFMNKQRSRYYYLNYFTAEQIVYLCNQLTQKNVTNLEDQALMMLSFIKPNCTIGDLRESWHVLQYEILKSPLEKNDDLDFQTFTEVPNRAENEIMELNTEEIFSIDVLDVFSSMDYESESLDTIWNAYMRNMQSFLCCTLDVRSLGRLLEILANSDSECEDNTEDAAALEEVQRNIWRELPTGLSVGKPNLIICPHAEILTSCISIYMSNDNEPLPTYDEVLLCEPSSPYEQVELFLRRCLTAGYQGQKIYTMLYIDQLPYEVSYKVEQFFQRYKAQSRNDYRLILICASDREHAYLPSAFSQFRLHMVPQEPMSRIQAYLDKHYTVPIDQCSAAAVFKNRTFVGVVSSRRAGVGKSLYIRRMYEKLKMITKRSTHLKCVRLIEPRIDENSVLQSMLNSRKRELTIFHFDVTSSVQKGLHEFLFRLLILGYLLDSEGRMWKCCSRHLYIIELLQCHSSVPRSGLRGGSNVQSAFLNVFPSIYCRSPKEVLELEMNVQNNPSLVRDDGPLMDDQEFRSDAYQRPYQYLKRFYNRCNLDGFRYKGVEGSQMECLQMLLVYCGVADPSWAELRNFAWFLNLQLRDCETSVFCDSSFTGDTLLGFKNFVVDFMILMAKDFATPSLSISDQSPGRVHMDLAGVNEEDLAPFRIRKSWESEPHPYIFFNDDHVSMTFIGFHLQPNEQNGVDAIDPTTERVIKKNIMTTELYEGLKLQRVPFNVDFDKLPRGEKIERICRVLGIQWPLDPDETYELTTDNILKILAIHMRFRCGIPVIIMGETGCGKTRLIKFLCELQRSGVATENMKLVKVHGGTNSNMIYTKVREAEAISITNKQDYGFDSVLFFDEANTTEAISSIKEVLCDKTVEGESMVPYSGLQIIAACNPYRKHTDVMIKRLESAGLGYRVRAEETDEKLGSIPLRQLVYRVQALPPSMIPLVWDFGQLNDHTEKMYIQQIVQRVAEKHSFNESYIKMITDILSASQKYMRTRKDECSFVSLRDVERCMQVFTWFYQNNTMLLSELTQYEGDHRAQRTEESQGDELDERDPILWSLVMAVGVCYHACLEDKEKYRVKICKYFPQTYSPEKLMEEISIMQDLLLSGVPLGETIARNSALKENVFMMVVCIELRIPLFLVGKPGSSKSLSKTLVADAMQGQAAHSDLYRKLKQIHLVSFQCSPHSTPEGIINTFKQCARFQEGKNLNEYISVVVLDEIGLAEDSPKMPLKTLHPLLEEGCIDDNPLPHKKVGFIGISNWALDPAKMNRGIFVSRGDPDEKELIESAKGICSSDAMILEKVREFFQPFARAYLNICRKQGKGFFGLRDYYSLIKMIFAITKALEQKPSPEQIVEAVLRNFSGKDNVNAVTVFTDMLKLKPNLEAISAIELVRQNITAIGQDEECRYLLVLTKNYAALQILQQTFFSEQYQPEIIFGSSFPKDQEYTQICRNINRVKICMETGQTVVLLNLQNLYESLYDALNQYYVCLGGQKYVDLGLGTHRVKCRVHKSFKLIVIEEKEVVYKQFPIPLINRLEKHFLDINTVLKNEQNEFVKELERWVRHFIAPRSQHFADSQPQKFDPADVFIGYHSDTCASVILQVTEKRRGDMELSDPHRQVMDEAKLILLNCAAPDAVVRLDNMALSRVESEHLSKVYFEVQKHSSLVDFILFDTQQEERSYASFTEVTTFSRLLTAADLGQLQEVVPNIEILALQQFDTEHSFLKKIKNFLDSTSENKILIIQTDFDEDLQSSNLIASAKYSSINEINKCKNEEVDKSKTFVYFITKLPRMEGGTSYVGFHGGPWKSVHIDDLRRSKDIVSDIKALQYLTISQLFDEKEDELEAMEAEEMYRQTEEQEMEQVKSISLENVLDTTTLVRSCVQSAVGMLRDQGGAGHRSTRRVEVLLTLLSDGGELQATFLKTVKRRLHSLLITHDENAVFLKNWVIKEASNIDALQEGGTFRHTLWKRIQVVVIPFLAQLVSVIDRDHNLELLVDTNSGESVKKLWLDIFGNDKFLNIPYTRVDSSSLTKTILVQNYITGKMGCIMPFSWRIKDYLEELWVHALHREGHSQRQFDEFFWKTPLGRCIAEAESTVQVEFFQRYLQDFISLTINVTSEVELQLLSEALMCCVNELKEHQEGAENDAASLPWVHAAYHGFKNRIQNLSRMISIEPQIAQVLLDKAQSREGMEMVLDVYAALACVEYLEPQALDACARSTAWLRQVKRLQGPVELVCSEESTRLYGERSKAVAAHVQHGWRRIHSLSLFVEHMVLGVEDVHQKLKPLVLQHTQRLAQVLEENSDLKVKQPFEAVITILKACKDGANELIFRFGFQLCPVCMGDPQDPLSLPCDHIYCLTCIRQWLIPGQMYCPLCMQGVNDDFDLRPSEAMRTLIKQNAVFRKQCNAFFIELVSTICFKDNSPPSRPIILHLLSFLMVEPGSMPTIRGRDRRFLTKALSPFDDSVDKNPVVRSVVLKLLLKYSFEEVKDYLQQHLTAVEQSNILEEQDKTELYSLYINCLEDSMFERTQWHSLAEQQTFLRDERNFLLELLQSGPVEANAATMEHLQLVARTRLCLDTAAGLLTSINTAAGAGESAFLRSVEDLCKSGNDWYRVYLIRKICNISGVEFVQKLLCERQYSWMFPREILQMNQNGSQIDQYLVYGVEYKGIRDALGKAMMECRIERLEEGYQACKSSPSKKTVYLLLALFREVTSLYRAADPGNHPTPKQLEALEGFIENSEAFSSPESRALAQALVHNQLRVLRLWAGAAGGEHMLVELVIHLAAVLLSARDDQLLLQPLVQLALRPASMQMSFIPTMPDDMLAIAQKAMGHLQWYYCPNGHPCTVGECGQPMEKSRCPDCGVEIGGTDHRPLQGFQAFAIHGDRTQSGHILGAPQRRDQPDMQDTKDMSPAPFTMIRVLTHLAMLLSASSHPQDISPLIKPPVEEPAPFLMAHLLKDMEQLSRALGKGADDTVCAVHLTICSLMEPQQPGQRPVVYNRLLPTKEDRNNWEVAMNTNVITQQLKDLEKQLGKVNAFIRKDERVSSNPVMKLTFGEPRLFLRSLPVGSLIHGSAVWSCRERPSLLSLAHIVEQNGGRDVLPVLWKFLHKEAELRMVKFLPDILALQRDLVKMFQNVMELPCSTITQFLQSHKAVSLMAAYEKRINIFLSTWNQLRASLATNGEIKLPVEFCQKDLDLGSDLQVLLPRRQGLGLCSTALVSYLIALHNEMVYTVEKYTNEETCYSMSPADLTELHVIRYEVERDLLPLVLSNCQYSMERGRETLSEYDLTKIQQQVVTRFLQGKPLITLTGIPTLVNRHDRNYENIFKDVKGKVDQDPLSSLGQASLVAELQGYSDVCEALSMVELALGFLAMTGGDAHMQLGVYLREELQMADHMAPHVLKTLSRCSLRHCVSLWQLLSALKSETMLRLKRDPFAGISRKYKQDLGENEKLQLTGFFMKATADSFLLEMHEFLLLVLKNPNATDTYKPSWSIKDTVLCYMERKDLEVPLDVQEFFPGEVLLSQFTEAWKFSVILKQERNQR